MKPIKGLDDYIIGHNHTSMDEEDMPLQEPKKDYLEKIKWLNEKCDNSLSIVCYTTFWNIYSYKDTYLSLENQRDSGVYPFDAKTLEDLVDKAYDFVEKQIEKEE